MDIVINVNVDAGKAVPKVEIKQPIKKVVKKKPFNGVLQFPEMKPRSSSPVLDILGIKET
jgi:hypothetical protein